MYVYILPGFPPFRDLPIATLTISVFSDHQVAVVERSRCQDAGHLGRFATRGRCNLAHLSSAMALAILHIPKRVPSGKLT